MKEAHSDEYEQIRRFKTRVNIIEMAGKLFQKFQKNLAQDEIERRILEEYEKRRRIYKKYLLSYQRGSNVLSDFHTNRF